MSASRKYESPLRKEQAEATRTRIMEALSRLIVEEHPSNISVPEVARRAGVSVRSVYHYFPTKESLYEGLSQWVQSQLGAGGEPPALSTPMELAAFLPTVFATLNEHRDLFEALRNSGHDDPVQRKRRLEARVVWIRSALEPATEGLAERDALKVTALAAHLSSFDVFERLTAMGLSDDETVEAVQWAILTIADRAKRSGHVDPPPSLAQKPADPDPARALPAERRARA